MQTLLVANRGEIAVRIMHTARRMGIRTVAVYTAGEENMPHVKKADCAVSLGSGTLQDTYLNSEKVIGIALQKGVDAIHPGYGFLSENAAFAGDCRQAGLIFVGPSSDAIRVMGNKVEALKTVRTTGVPLLEQYTGSMQELVQQRQELPYPVLVKAAAGGGGKGMRLVEGPDMLEQELEATSREALAYFGDGTVFIERYVPNPRHIEVQVMGDMDGNYVHLFERECSIQRRHQKIIEEAPSVTLSVEQREAITEAALDIARAIGYYNAGTVEFLVDEMRQFYFLEMNTRIQVEHPVTEMITGVDMVEEQLRIAEGKPLQLKQEGLRINGHAIEARLYAENPAQDFMPSPGKLKAFDYNNMQNIRVDAGVEAGNIIRADFDPMIAKAIALGHNRTEAAAQLAGFLDQAKLGGVYMNRRYLEAILREGDYLQNVLSTRYISQKHDQLVLKADETPTTEEFRFVLAAFLVSKIFTANRGAHAGYWRMLNDWQLQVHDKPLAVYFRIFEDALEVEPEGYTAFRIEQPEVGGAYLRFYLDKERCNVQVFTINQQEKLFFRNGKGLRVKRILPASGKRASGNGLHATKEEELVKAPMFGKVLDISVKEETNVKAGDTLMVLEAMKMENSIQATHDFMIKRINVKKGDQVQDGQVLLEVKQP